MKNENQATATVTLEPVVVATEAPAAARRQLQDTAPAVASPGPGPLLNPVPVIPTVTNGVAQCTNGTFIFDQLIVTQLPGTNMSLKFSITGLEDNGLPKSF